MLYEFTFPGRIYALGILLTFLICSFLTKIKEKPILFATLLALSFHTHFLFLAFSCPIAVYFIYKNYSKENILKSKYLISFSILIVSAIYFFWYIYALRKNYNAIFISDNKNNIIEIANKGLTLGQPEFIMLSFFTLLLFIIAQLKKFSALLISVFALSFMFYALMNVLPQFNRYYQIFPVVLMALIWFSATITPPGSQKNTVPKQTLKQVKKIPEVPALKPKLGFLSISQFGFYLLFAGCLLISSFKGINAVTTEYKLPHSDSKTAAAFINKNLLDYVLVGHRSYITSALVPYLPKGKSVWYADRKEFGTFLKFDSVYHKTNISVLFPAAIEAALKQFPKEQKLALILSIPLQQQVTKQWKLVYATRGEPIQQDESYFIYVRQ